MKSIVALISYTQRKHGQGHPTVYKQKLESGYHLIYCKLQQGVKSNNFCSSDIPVFGPQSYGGSDKITIICLSDRPSVRLFSQKWLISFFLIFGTMVDNWNILKLTELFFSRKRAQNGSKIGFIVFFSKFLSLVFLVNNLKWKLILLLIFHHQPHMRQNSGFKAALWVCVTRHAQSTQNSYFTWSL